jgi:hypothetical protein
MCGAESRCSIVSWGYVLVTVPGPAVRPTLEVGEQARHLPRLEVGTISCRALLDPGFCWDCVGSPACSCLSRPDLFCTAACRNTMLWRLPTSVRSLPLLSRRQRLHTRTAPPLRILFCGSDDFSIASLQALQDAKEADPQLIKSIEVVHRPANALGEA